SAPESDEEDGQGRDQRGAGGETIEAVDQVERVRDPENPEDSQNDRDRQVIGTERDPRKYHFETEGKKEQPREDLRDELDACAEADDIVVESQREHERAGYEKPDDVVGREVEARYPEGLGDGQQDGADDECRVDPHAAQAWDGHLMDVAVEERRR